MNVNVGGALNMDCVVSPQNQWVERQKYKLLYGQFYKKAITLCDMYPGFYDSC